jgi:hypothetical protein
VWWIDITGNQIDLKRQWFIKRNGAYNMLWTTGPHPLHYRRRGGAEGVFRKSRRRKRWRGRWRRKKKTTLNAIVPSGFTLWPAPRPGADRLSSASRPSGTQHRCQPASVTHPYVAVLPRNYTCAPARVRFENTLTSTFARFSISPPLPHPSPNRRARFGFPSAAIIVVVVVHATINRYRTATVMDRS